jgi:hypothetical protein
MTAIKEIKNIKAFTQIDSDSSTADQVTFPVCSIKYNKSNIRFSKYLASSHKI